MKKICQKAIELLENGESFAQATILVSSGSTPRKAGAYMLITKDGQIEGTVGGGILEANIIKAAGRIIKERKPEVITVTLDGNDAAAQGSICGGTASVLIDYINPDPNSGNHDYYTALQSALHLDARARIVTAVPDESNDYRLQCVLRSNGSLAGAIRFDPAVTAELSNKSHGYDAFTRLEKHQLYLHPIGTDGTVYIFGAGHCGEKLAHVLASVGFDIVVIDDREEFANALRFPDANAILVPQSMDKPFTAFEFDLDSYIVIVTRGHTHDELVLREALKTKAGYIGMIGSRKKRETIYRHLLDEGFSQDAIDNVYSPIGMEIGAETPEEIAVSIAAELIKVRAGRRSFDS